MDGKFQDGFTLIELMTTVVIVALILTLGVPGFQEMVARNRVTTKTNSLVAALVTARNEAIKTGRNAVVVCKRNSSGTACDNSSHWEDGWLLFIDANADGAFSDNGNTALCEKDAAGQLTEDCLIQAAAPLSGLTITTAGANNNFGAWLGYKPNGKPIGSGCSPPDLKNCNVDRSIPIPGTVDVLRICRKESHDVSKARFVIVNITGNIKTQSCDTYSGACASYTCP